MELLPYSSGIASGDKNDGQRAGEGTAVTAIVAAENSVQIENIALTGSN